MAIKRFLLVIFILSLFSSPIFAVYYNNSIIVTNIAPTYDTYVGCSSDNLFGSNGNHEGENVLAAGWDRANNGITEKAIMQWDLSSFITDSITGVSFVYTATAAPSFTNGLNFSQLLKPFNASIANRTHYNLTHQWDRLCLNSSGGTPTDYNTSAMATITYSGDPISNPQTLVLNTQLFKNSISNGISRTIFQSANNSGGGVQFRSTEYTTAGERPYLSISSFDTRLGLVHPVNETVFSQLDESGVEYLPMIVYSTYNLTGAEIEISVDDIGASRSTFAPNTNFAMLIYLQSALTTGFHNYTARLYSPNNTLLVTVVSNYTLIKGNNSFFLRNPVNTNVTVQTDASGNQYIPFSWNYTSGNTLRAAFIFKVDGNLIPNGTSFFYNAPASSGFSNYGVNYNFSIFPPLANGFHTWSVYYYIQSPLDPSAYRAIFLKSSNFTVTGSNATQNAITLVSPISGQTIALTPNVQGSNSGIFLCYSINVPISYTYDLVFKIDNVQYGVDQNLPATQPYQACRTIPSTSELPLAQGLHVWSINLLNASNTLQIKESSVTESFYLLSTGANTNTQVRLLSPYGSIQVQYLNQTPYIDFTWLTNSSVSTNDRFTLYKVVPDPRNQVAFSACLNSPAQQAIGPFSIIGNTIGATYQVFNLISCSIAGLVGNNVLTTTEPVYTRDFNQSVGSRQVHFIYNLSELPPLAAGDYAWQIEAQDVLGNRILTTQQLYFELAADTPITNNPNPSTQPKGGISTNSSSFSGYASASINGFLGFEESSTYGLWIFAFLLALIIPAGILFAAARLNYQHGGIVSAVIFVTELVILSFVGWFPVLFGISILVICAVVITLWIRNIVVVPKG